MKCPHCKKKMKVYWNRGESISVCEDCETWRKNN